MYWSDWNPEAPKIESCTVEGQLRKVLVHDGIQLPNALTFDDSARRLCWADAGTNSIHWCLNMKLYQDNMTEL